MIKTGAIGILLFAVGILRADFIFSVSTKVVATDGSQTQSCQSTISRSCDSQLLGSTADAGVGAGIGEINIHAQVNDFLSATGHASASLQWSDLITLYGPANDVGTVVWDYTEDTNCGRGCELPVFNGSFRYTGDLGGPESGETVTMAQLTLPIAFDANGLAQFPLSENESLSEGVIDDEGNGKVFITITGFQVFDANSQQLSAQIATSSGWLYGGDPPVPEPSSLILTGFILALGFCVFERSGMRARFHHARRCVRLTGPYRWPFPLPCSAVIARIRPSKFSSSLLMRDSEASTWRPIAAVTCDRDSACRRWASTTPSSAVSIRSNLSSVVIGLSPIRARVLGAGPQRFD